MLILGHLNTINFPFGTNGKLMGLDVPIFKHIRVGVFLSKGDSVHSVTSEHANSFVMNL